MKLNNTIPNFLRPLFVVIILTSISPRSFSQNSTENHSYIDLGLPSGIFWATCNIGASNPSDYGCYFAWGETKVKDRYNWENLEYCVNGKSYDNIEFSKYFASDNNTINLEISDDAANLNWGENWRMPTCEEWEELFVNCVWLWTSKDGHNGYQVTSKKNGNSIFIPAAGWYNDSSLYGIDKGGYYWSSTLSTNSHYACNCLFGSSVIGPLYWGGRCRGQSIRPVYSVSKN